MTDGEPTQLLLAAPGAARVLDVSQRTLWRLVRRGDLEVVRLSPRIVRFRVADLAALGAPDRVPMRPYRPANGRRGQ